MKNFEFDSNTNKIKIKYRNFNYIIYLSKFDYCKNFFILLDEIVLTTEKNFFKTLLEDIKKWNMPGENFFSLCGKPNINILVNQKELFYFLNYVWIFFIIKKINRQFFHEVALQYHNLPIINLKFDIDEIEETVQEEMFHEHDEILEKESDSEDILEDGKKPTDFKKKKKTFNISIVEQQAKKISQSILKYLNNDIPPETVKVCITSRKFTNSFHYSMNLPMGRISYELFMEKIKPELSDILLESGFKLDSPVNGLLPFGRQHTPIFFGNLDVLNVLTEKNNFSWDIVETCCVFPLKPNPNYLFNFLCKRTNKKNKTEKKLYYIDMFLDKKIEYVEGAEDRQIVPIRKEILKIMDEGKNDVSLDNFINEVNENSNESFKETILYNGPKSSNNVVNLTNKTTMKIILKFKKNSKIMKTKIPYFNETFSFKHNDILFIVHKCEWFTEEVSTYIKIDNRKLTFWEQYNTTSISFNDKNKILTPLDYKNTIEEDLYDPSGFVARELGKNVDTEKDEEDFCSRLEKINATVTNYSKTELEDIWKLQLEINVKSISKYCKIYVLSHPIFHNNFTNYSFTPRMLSIIKNNQKIYNYFNGKSKLEYIVQEFLMKKSKEWVCILLILYRSNHKVNIFEDYVQQFIENNASDQTFSMFERKDKNVTCSPKTICFNDSDGYDSDKNTLESEQTDSEDPTKNVKWMIHIIFNHLNNFNVAAVIADLVQGQEKSDSSRILGVINAILQYPIVDRNFSLNKNALFKLFSYFTVPKDGNQFNNETVLSSYVKSDFIFFQARLYFVTYILDRHTSCYLENEAEATKFFSDIAWEYFEPCTFIDVDQGLEILNSLSLKITLKLYPILMSEICCVFKLDKIAMIFSPFGYIPKTIPALSKLAQAKIADFDLINNRSYEFFTPYGITNMVFEFVEMGSPSNFIVATSRLKNAENINANVFVQPHCAFFKKFSTDVFMKLHHFVKFISHQKLLTLCLAPIIPIEAQNTQFDETSRIQYKIENFTVSLQDFTNDDEWYDEVYKKILNLRDNVLDNVEEPPHKRKKEHVCVGQTEKFKTLAFCFLNLTIYLSSLSCDIRVPNTVFGMILNFFNGGIFNTSCFPEMEKNENTYRLKRNLEIENMEDENPEGNEMLEENISEISDLQTHATQIIKKMPKIFDLLEREKEKNIVVVIPNSDSSEEGIDPHENLESVQNSTSNNRKKYITFQDGFMDIDHNFTLSIFQEEMIDFNKHPKGLLFLKRMNLEKKNARWYLNIFFLLTWFIRCGPERHMFYDTQFFSFIRKKKKLLYEEISEFISEITGPVLKMHKEYLRQYLFEFVEKTEIVLNDFAVKMMPHDPSLAIARFYDHELEEMDMEYDWEFYSKEYVETSSEYNFNVRSVANVIDSFSDLMTISGFNVNITVIISLILASFMYRRNINRDIFLFTGLSASGKTTFAQNICELFASNISPWKVNFKNGSGDINSNAQHMAYNIVVMRDEMSETVSPELLKMAVNAYGTNESRDIHSSVALLWPINATFICTSNFLMRGKSEDEALLRRVKIVPFEHRFVPIVKERDRFFSKDFELSNTTSNLGGQLIESAFEQASNTSTCWMLIFRFFPTIFFNKFDTPVTTVRTQFMEKLNDNYLNESSLKMSFLQEFTFTESEKFISKEEMRSFIFRWYEEKKQ